MYWGNNHFNSHQPSWLHPPSYKSYTPYKTYWSNYQYDNQYEPVSAYQPSSKRIVDSHDPVLAQYNAPPVLEGQFTNQDEPTASFYGIDMHQSYDHNQFSNLYVSSDDQQKSPEILNGQFLDPKYSPVSFTSDQQPIYETPLNRYLINIVDRQG